MNKWQLSVEDLVAVATLNFQEFMLDWKTIKYLDGSTEWLLVEDCQNLDYQDPDQQQLNLNQNQIQHQTVSIYPTILYQII
mgnify:CR=1 FL=1